MAGLQTKVGQYEREVQQLRRALLKSDTYIEDLTTKLESPTGQSTPKPKRAHIITSPVPSSCTITSLSEDKEPLESSKINKSTDAVDVESSHTPDDASPSDDSTRKKRFSTTSDHENVTSNGHSPILAPVSNERFSLENATSYGEERASALSSRRSSEVSLYGQDLDIPPGPLTSSLNILEPVEGEALDRPPSRGELLLLGDPSNKRQEKSALEENLNMFTASRRLMMMSERRSRHRETLEPSKLLRDLGECSPSSSEGGKRKSVDTKSLDFDLFTSATVEDSPSNSASQESPPPTYSRDTELTESGSPCFHTFSLAKIKSEIEIGNEDETTAKRPRLESEEFQLEEDEEDGKEEKT